MYRNWWHVPVALALSSFCYVLLESLFHLEHPAAQILFSAAIFVAAGLLLRRRCAPQAMILGVLTAAAPGLLYSLLTALFPDPSMNLWQNLMGLGFFCEFFYGLFIRLPLPGALWLPSLLPLLWIPFGWKHR